MIYLDNAATTFPKPKIVKDSITEWVETGVGSPGRGSQGAAIKADSRVLKVRKHLAKFFGVIDEFRIIFTYSATDALNLGIKGFVERGDHVIISSIEHNSVLRPLRHLEMDGIITLDIVACDKDGYIDVEQLWQKFTDKTKLVVISHASNVLGSVQPITEIGQGVRERGAYLLVDAAQTAGVLSTNLDELNADMLACAGHKGLFGLPGTGLLILGERIQKLESWRQGGTGYNSESEFQPINWPEKFEAGTLNMPGIISLGKGVEFIESEGIEQIMKREHQHFEMLWEGLSGIPNIRLYGPNPDQPRVAVLSMNIDGWEPDDVADILQHNYQIQVRSGLQCSPLAHQVIGTHPEGTVRISPGYFTETKEIKRLINAIKNTAMTQVDWMF
jgi:cysteine desulfurase family protein